MSVLGIDIGAATIDLALLSGGDVQVLKCARDTAETGPLVAAALARAGTAWSLRPETLDEVRIGSTSAINRLLARDVARIGLITNRGFADLLALGRQNRADLHDPVARSPAPVFLVAPGAIREVEGRLGPDGAEIAPLAAREVRDAGTLLAAQGVEAIAVCLLFAHVNPAHEAACAAILAEAAPGIPVILSHDVDPMAREYERAVSTCLEAALRPSIERDNRAIAEALRGAGFAGRLSFADSRGHLLSPGAALRIATAQLVGGPAVSARASAALARAQGLKRALAIDVGSTTTDIVLIEEGEPATATYGVIGGVPLRAGMTDITNIALGGQSAVTLSTGAGIRFCQQGAPDALHLTDALVVLGELAPQIAPGALARLAAVAGPGGTAPEELARRIVDAALDRLAESVLRHAVSRNVDPATVPLVANGGLGPVLARALAERLGSPMILIEPHAAVSGAVGLLHARHAQETTIRVNAPLARLDEATLHSVTADLSHSAGAACAGAALSMSVAPDAFMHPVRLDLTGSRVQVAALAEGFAAWHLAQLGSHPRKPGFVFALHRLHLEEALPLPAPDASLCRIAPPGMGPRPETLQMRLNAIAQRMQEVLFRTAVSPVVREGNDAAAALLTPEGELLALSDAIPLLLGALDGASRAILELFPADTMQEGDLFIMNDPFLGGTHLPDLTVLRPVFAAGRLVALAASMLHHQDVGGMRPGSVPPDAVDIFQEGLRLPPMRLGRGDRIGHELEALIRSNSRAPDTVLGDLASQIAAARQAAASIAALAAEFTPESFAAGLSACLARGEALARESIAAMSQGPHPAREAMDPMPGLPDIEILLELRCTEGRFVADFAGTSPQVPAPVNCVRSGPFAAALYSVLSAMGDTIFRNGGVARCIELRLPEGCAINATPPAAVNARMGIVRATTSAFLQAFARALPERMPAANSGMSFVLAFSGLHDDGSRFIVTEIVAGGAGGGPHADGAHGISTDVGNAMNMPAEALESQIPLRLLQTEIRRGSGGAGHHRGGDGIRRIYLALRDGIDVSVRGERFRTVPAGLAGGDAPSPAAARVIRRDGSVEHLASRSTPRLDAGDRLVVESCGGAGYGPPEGGPGRDQASRPGR
ncbi:MAG: hydantoinase B/oxoprolinase family protein [Rhodobacteraceae bacterium]|nr:hydantoinase B/oxoprolinase family protein [Paracoccaceae bacterium]